MSEVKFIHTADLHLDTPFKGLSSWNSELSKKLKDATFRSFKTIIDQCIGRKVDFLIISGDVFDNENKSLAARLRFEAELKRLAQKGINAYISCGNHDPFDEDRISEMPDKVYYFNPHTCEYKTFSRGDEPVADIHGISFGEAKVKNNLAKKFRLAEKPSPLSIAVLHGCIGSPGKHEAYAPFSFEDISGKGFDYWALGHIHKSSVVNRANPAVVYPGNPQGRDFGETGEKGCYCVTISEGRDPQLEFIPVHTVRFEDIEIDLTGIGTLDDMQSEITDRISAIGERINIILRITLKGRTPLHRQLNGKGEIEQLLEAFNENQLQNDPFVWIDRFTVLTQPDIDTDTIRNGEGFPSEVLKTLSSYLENPEKMNELFGSEEQCFTYAQALKLFEPLTEEDRKAILRKAGSILIDRLIP